MAAKKAVGCSCDSNRKGNEGEPIEEPIRNVDHCSVMGMDPDQSLPDHPDNTGAHEHSDWKRQGAQEQAHQTDFFSPPTDDEQNNKKHSGQYSERKRPGFRINNESQAENVKINGAVI